MCSHGIWLGLNSGEKPPPSHAIGTVTQRYITRTETVDSLRFSAFRFNSHALFESVCTKKVSYLPFDNKDLIFFSKAPFKVGFELNSIFFMLR